MSRKKKPTKTTKSSAAAPLYEDDGAKALLAAVFTFLKNNGVSQKSIIALAKTHDLAEKFNISRHRYDEAMRVYGEMAMLLATWYSNPKFLDGRGQPIVLTESGDCTSVKDLIKVSGARITLAVATSLMRQSPSIGIDSAGGFTALQRVFILEKLEVPRAAFVVERFLDTLQEIKSSKETGSLRPLERSCHVSQVDLSKSRPLMRDIKDKATAFMDSIDGDIENQRVRGSNHPHIGEMGVMVFAWQRPSHRRNIVREPIAVSSKKVSKKYRLKG